MNTSATATAPSPTPAPRPSRRPYRLRRRPHRALLVVHIVAAGAWIGIDVVLGILVLTAALTDRPGTAGLAYQAVGLFAVWPLVATGLVCLASGVLLGLGTRWGLVRYWWVAVKLAMNVVLSLLVAFALRPGVAEVVEHGRALAAGTPSDVDVTGMFFPPVVSLVALTTATVLSVFKPWGRIAGTARSGGRP